MKQRLAIASILLAWAVGCGGSSPPPPSSPQGSAQTGEATAATGVGVDEDESTADLAEHHRHHHHGGFAMFIAMSLDSLGVSPEQHDAIAKIQKDMHAKMQPAHDAEKAVLLALADGVAAGQVDDAKLAPTLAQLSTASAGIHDAVADSLNALHQTLTPPQRQALVDKVESHLEVWVQTNDGKGGHLEQLAKNLGLSQDQVEKIRSSFATSIATVPKYDRQEADAHFKAFAAAFTTDTFDAKTLTNGGPVNAHMAMWGVMRVVHLFKAATPVLTPEQRTKAAEDLRRHANYKRSDET